MQNDTLATGIMSFLMHEIVYFGRSLPYIIIDAIPAFNRYKIQNVSANLGLPARYPLLAPQATPNGALECHDADWFSFLIAKNTIMEGTIRLCCSRFH